MCNGEAIGDDRASVLRRRHRVTVGGVAIDSATRRDTPRIGAPVLAAAAVEQGRRLRLGPAMFPDDVLERWRQAEPDS